jgi:chromate transporter
MSENPYLGLIQVFVPLSLVTIGGGASVFAAIQHEAVDIHHWVSAREFVDLFAIARSAPGPGSMLVTLIGWKIAGWSGALVATVAMFLPCLVLCLAVARTWAKHKGKPWHRALEAGLAPVGTGLVTAGLISIFRIINGDVLTIAVAIATAALLLARPQAPPLVLLIMAGGLFAARSLI